MSRQSPKELPSAAKAHEAITSWERIGNNVSTGTIGALGVVAVGNYLAVMPDMPPLTYIAAGIAAATATWGAGTLRGVKTAVNDYAASLYQDPRETPVAAIKATKDARKMSALASIAAGATAELADSALQPSALALTATSIIALVPTITAAVSRKTAADSLHAQVNDIGDRL